MSRSLSENYREILIGLGEDPDREGLLDTPVRAAKAMQYLCHGYEQSVDQIVNGALFASDSDEMIIVADIELYSLCEHHLLPFIGKAHVAYIPTGKVLGLSKIARLVDMFARRLQIQENLTRQIADAVQQVTDAAGVAVGAGRRVHRHHHPLEFRRAMAARPRQILGPKQGAVRLDDQPLHLLRLQPRPGVERLQMPQKPRRQMGRIVLRRQLHQPPQRIVARLMCDCPARC